MHALEKLQSEILVLLENPKPRFEAIPSLVNAWELKTHK